MDNIENQIIETLNKVRPFLKRDGGDLEFVKFVDGIVYIKLVGACLTCTIQDVTIKQGIEVILQEEVEGVISVHVTNSDIANQ